MRILYVEDNFQNMLLVKRIVEADGHTLLEATNGRAGWQMAVSARPSLILVDLQLPGEMSGLDLIRRLKKHPGLQQTPVVVLTAHGQDEVEHAARDAGCDEFLRKPADIRQIRSVIEHFSPAMPPPAPAGIRHYAFL
jgi:CheY-like chemotaxis protein